VECSGDGVKNSAVSDGHPREEVRVGDEPSGADLGAGEILDLTDADRNVGGRAEDAVAVEPGRRGAPARPRSTLRSVGLPSEHGGWGLTGEPVLLGLIIAPSWAGLALGLAAVLAFLARTPTKVALGDLRRGRWMPRTRVAGALAVAEISVIVALGVFAVTRSPAAIWWPLLVVAPLMALELAYDIRSRGRRLVPELAGAVGIAGLATMIVLAGSSDLADAVPIAIAVWLVLAARAVTAIPFVRDQVQRMHDRTPDGPPLVVTDAVAVALVVAAVLLAPEALAGALAVVVVVALQRVLPAAGTAVAMGARQTAMGVAVVVVTACGILLNGGVP